MYRRVEKVKNKKAVRAAAADALYNKKRALSVHNRTCIFCFDTRIKEHVHRDAADV